jgi:hypothetical protein
MKSPRTESNTEIEFSWKWLTGGWSITVLVTVLLIFGFYLEEDWRGAVSWSQARQEITTQGETFDPDKFIPAPVPDDQNFGVLPLFELQPGGSPGEMLDVGMKRAFALVNPYSFSYSSDSAKEAGQFPYLGDWKKAEKPDLPAIRKRLAEICQKKLSDVHIPADATPVDIFEILCPALADLRAANKTHPLCRFDIDYASMPPFNRSLRGITDQIELAKVLSYEERLALLTHQSALAADDLEVGWKVDLGIRQQPLLISGLVSMGVVAIQMGVVTEGLGTQAWNDQQLTNIDNDLGKIDYLTESQFCVRGDLATGWIPNLDYSKNHRAVIREMIWGASRYSGSSSPADFLVSSLAYLVPDGWFDELKADQARFNLLGVVKMVDPATRRIFPDREEKALHLIEDLKETEYWRNFLTNAFSSSISSVKRFAFAQVQVDEARIACRLERFHLTHNVYPDSLDALSPAYGAEIPKDIMNGRPYHYKLLADGTFLLYSVGWDQVDDGGEMPAPEHQSNQTAPDWTWGNHPNPKKTK